MILLFAVVGSFNKERHSKIAFLSEAGQRLAPHSLSIQMLSVPWLLLSWEEGLETPPSKLPALYHQSWVKDKFSMKAAGKCPVVLGGGYHPVRSNPTQRLIKHPINLTFDEMAAFDLLQATDFPLCKLLPQDSSSADVRKARVTTIVRVSPCLM